VITDAREAVVLRQIRWRILPLLFAGYFAAYIDRVNVGFAALTMNQALGLSAAEYGLGGGLFFAGYVAFGVPSNLVLARLGARRWLPLIMVCWALASLLNAWATGPTSFYAIRLVLGVAEAGLYPGLLYVLTEWLPGRYRVRMITLLVLSTPFSIMLGSLISQPILRMDGIGGLAGWQWLFVLQALPTIALALIFFIAMPDSPATAPWLTPANRQWLVEQLARERSKREQVGRFSVRDALTNPTVWLIALAGIGINFAAYGLILFLPQMIHALGVSTTLTPLNVDAEPQIGNFIGDQRRVVQVLYNLLANAVGFSPHDATVVISARRTDHRVTFTVSDTGPGIPSDVKDKVFDWFESHSHGSRHRGAGLGLSLVRSFVELHGGKVRVDSVVGKGTTVVCDFPVDQKAHRNAAE